MRWRCVEGTTSVHFEVTRVSRDDRSWDGDEEWKPLPKSSAREGVTMTKKKRR